jgi:hypothetical protein
MLLTAMHFTSALLAALVMGTTLAHALEMPAKMRVSASFWFALSGPPIPCPSVFR